MAPSLKAPIPGNAAKATQLLAKGSHLHQQGDYAGAAKAFRKVLSLQPANLTALSGLGAALLVGGNPSDAVVPLEQAATAHPTLVGPAFLLGHAHRNRGDRANAVRWYHAASQLEPQNPDILAYLGESLRQAGHPIEGRRFLALARQVAPDRVQTTFFDGLISLDLGEYYAALTAFEHVLAVMPDQAGARWNRAIVLLLLGDFARGWAEHEARTVEVKNLGQWREAKGPRWDGSDPQGKRILVLQEQGIGDQLQFLRFARVLKARGAHVIFECDAPLATLLTGHPFLDTLVVKGNATPPYDAWVPLMSLPYRLGITDDFRTESAAYVQPVPASTIDVADVHALPGRRIGLVWGGAPSHTNDRNRSIGLAPLTPLFDIPGISWVSLQKGARAAERMTLPAATQAQLLDVSDRLADFADTARMIAALDVVITVDTSVAHLAGAMGVPTWVLVPFVPDWRWLVEGDTSAWYPTVRLFRQPVRDDWASVVSAVTRALSAM